jgi:hypothetical protein
MAGEQTSPEVPDEFKNGRGPVGDGDGKPEFRPPLNPSLNGAAHHDSVVPTPVEEEEEEERRIDLGMAIDALTLGSVQRRAHGQHQIELRAWGPGRNGVLRLHVHPELLVRRAFEGLVPLRDWMRDANDDRRHAGFVVNPHVELLEGESANWQGTTGVVAFWLEVVLGDVGADRLHEEAERLIRRSPLPPTQVVTTGTGLDMYFCLDEIAFHDLDPAERREAFADLQRRIQAHAWVLPVLTPNQARRQGNPPHLNALSVQVAAVMRLPGTWNFRCDPPQLCEVVANDVRYTLATIQNAFPPPRLGPPDRGWLAAINDDDDGSDDGGSVDSKSATSTDVNYPDADGLADQEGI